MNTNNSKIREWNDRDKVRFLMAHMSPDELRETDECISGGGWRYKFNPAGEIVKIDKIKLRQDKAFEGLLRDA